MSIGLSQISKSETEETIKQLKHAIAVKKCWACGCFHNLLLTIEEAIAPAQRNSELNDVIKAAYERLVPKKYDCLGCDVCYAALAINSIEQAYNLCSAESEVCSGDKIEARKGWPPLPGAYTVLKYRAPVAICTLTDEALASIIANNSASDIAIVGTLQTENLGIERLIWNIITNPNIRFLILCGADSKKSVGHLPGQSLMALEQSGIDSKARIIGAKGKRPILRNITPDAIDHFRQAVNIIDLIGNVEPSEIMNAVASCSKRNPGRAEPFTSEGLLKPVRGYLPQSVIPDPAGYFVIYIDRDRQLLLLEHYKNNGLLDTVIEGKSAAELYSPAIEKGLVSRLDHAAYLGKELARAEQALVSGDQFIQDAAPEHKISADTGHSCSCGSACKEE